LPQSLFTGRQSPSLPFQSHNGAIAAAAAMRASSSASSVSIPQWCDCCCRAPLTNLNTTLFQSHNGAIAAKAKFWDLRAKGKEMVRGLQSTFGCLKTLRGSTATEPSKLGYFGLKLPPHLYLAFKVLKTA
jgi:hypothetical protein